MRCVSGVAILALYAACFAHAAIAQQQAAPLPADAKPDAEAYQTLYLRNMTSGNEANDVLTDMRNIFGSKARLFMVPGQHAISIRATPDQIVLAQKIISDLDRPQPTYRLVYTFTEMDGGKRLGSQSVALVVASGEKSELNQGSRVPVLTGAGSSGTSAENSQVQYLDIGLDIQASVDSSADGVRLRSKINQSSLADDKPASGGQDPIIRHTDLEGTATLVLGKPLVLGALDVPGSTRHEEIAVTPELIR